MTPKTSPKLAVLSFGCPPLFAVDAPAARTARAPRCRALDSRHTLISVTLGNSLLLAVPCSSLVTGMKGRGQYHTTFAACTTRDRARTTPLHEHTPLRAHATGNKQTAESSTGSRRPCARAVPSNRALLNRKFPSSRGAAGCAHPPFSMESETETGLREHLPARGRGATGGQRCRLPE